MRYTVVWSQSARDDLAALWLAAADRSAITAAANTIDTVLAVNPARRGLPVSEGLCAFSAPPLRILFEIREADRIVEVLSVKFL